MSMRAFGCVAAFAAMILSVGAASAEEQPEWGRTVWALGSAGFGFGGHRLGALYAAAAVEAHVWLFDDIAIGVRYAGIATGAPDGPGGQGSAISGIVSYRHAFGTIANTKDTQGWFLGSLGVGAMHLSGYDGRMRGRDDYDTRSVLLTPRVAMLQSWRFLAFGGALEAAIAPGQGVSGSVSMLAGAIF